MKEGKISFLGGTLLWFGAAVSIAEISTGALLAPLGFKRGLIAIICGHIIGCILLYFAGLIGAKSKMNAMETVSLSFGKRGSIFFSVLNILQLLGWTAVMIIGGARAIGALVPTGGSQSNALWCVIIGVLIAIWVVVGINNLEKINIVAVGGLLTLTIALAVVIFKGAGTPTIMGVMSFGLALELSVAMPVSWLPLIADYTKDTDKPFKFTLASVLCYFCGSTFMYAIGLAGAIFMQTSDIVEILVRAELGIVAMFIVVFSTVTTTFLDVYSVGESANVIMPNVNKKLIAIMACVVGTMVAIFAPIEQYQNFLSLIGSVFVPMITILITDYFVLKIGDNNDKINIKNSVLWLLGFAMYQFFLKIDGDFGSTIPVMIILATICAITDKITKRRMKNV